MKTPQHVFEDSKGVKWGCAEVASKSGITKGGALHRIKLINKGKITEKQLFQEADLRASNYVVIDEIQYTTADVTRITKCCYSNAYARIQRVKKGEIGLEGLLRTFKPKEVKKIDSEILTHRTAGDLD